MREPKALVSTQPAGRLIASGSGWEMNEVVCRAGPQNPPFEEMHEGFAIAAVIEGSFTYRTENYRALLHPGAFMLGNFQSCFECGHDHGTGDRCVALHLSPEYFSEIAATSAGSSRYRFPAAMLPVTRQMTQAIVGLEMIATCTPERLEETVAELTETVIALVSGESRCNYAVTVRDARRIGETVRYIESHSSEPLDLTAMAKIALMSKYHFLRTFQRAVGMSPYRFLLGVRLRRAATLALKSATSVSSIAFACGFGDLSTFNAQFRTLFGMSPRAYKRYYQSTPGPRGRVQRHRTCSRHTV